MGLGPFERSRELITRYDLLLRFAFFPLTIEKEREEERRERRGRIGSSREPRFTEGSVPLFYFAFTSSPPLLFFSFFYFSSSAVPLSFLLFSPPFEFRVSLVRSLSSPPSLFRLSRQIFLHISVPFFVPAPFYIYLF